MLRMRGTVPVIVVIASMPNDIETETPWSAASAD